MNELGISTKIIKPENCILAFGIPASKKDFERHKIQNDSDFVKIFNKIWGRYYYEFVSNVERVAPLITELGVSIVYNLTLDDFESLFIKNDIDVIILFSHWNSSSIEFDDGLANIQTIIDRIPVKFSGILDLCVCHPEELTKSLREFRPNCLVKYTHKKATPDLWLYFYIVLFKYIKHHNVSYLKALEIIINEFLTNNKET